MSNYAVVKESSQTSQTGVDDVEKATPPTEENKAVRFPWLHPVKIAYYFAPLHLACTVLNLAFAAYMRAEPVMVFDTKDQKFYETDSKEVCSNSNPAVIAFTAVASFLTIALILCGLLELKLYGGLARPMKKLFKFRMLMYYSMSAVAFGLSVSYTNCMRDYLDEKRFEFDSNGVPVVVDDTFPQLSKAKASLALACIGCFSVAAQLGLTALEAVLNG